MRKLLKKLMGEEFKELEMVFKQIKKREFGKLRELICWEKIKRELKRIGKQFLKECSTLKGIFFFCGRILYVLFAWRNLLRNLIWVGMIIVLSYFPPGAPTGTIAGLLFVKAKIKQLFPKEMDSPPEQPD